MIIYIASDGQARLVSPQHVYQGSSVTDITVIAPFPAQTVMTVAFSLPDGKTFGGVQGTMQTPPYIMTPLANQPELPDGVYAWQYVMASAITQNAGQAKVSITAQFAQGSGTATAFTQQTSAQVEFTIEPSVVGKLPDEPTEDAWAQVLAYMSAQDTKIAAIQSDVADIEQVADEANTNADTALTTANEANTTATQAKDTADGLADSIAQANVTASQAEQTAQEAKEIAEGAAQSNGTRVSVGGAFQQTLSFTSDPQTQITANKNAIAEAQSDISDIVSGAQTVGKATQDANGNVIDTTYAKLSQVVRTDTAQSLTDAQKNTVAQNIERSAGRTVNSGGVGWYNILTADINGYFVADLSVVSGYSNQEPTEVKIIAIGGHTVPGLVNTRASITCFSGGALSQFISKVRVRNIGSQVCIDVYIPYNTTTYFNNMNVVLNSWKTVSDKMPQVQPFTFVDTEDDADNVSICEVIPNGISTNGQIYQQGAPVFATDPTKLAPSTANGWTQTTSTGTLPSAGTYYVFPGATSSVGILGTAIIVFDGTNNTFGATGGLNVVNVGYAHNNPSKRWFIAYAGGEEINSEYILYKRIN